MAPAPNDRGAHDIVPTIITLCHQRPRGGYSKHGCCIVGGQEPRGQCTGMEKAGQVDGRSVGEDDRDTNEEKMTIRHGRKMQLLRSSLLPWTPEDYKKQLAVIAILLLPLRSSRNPAIRFRIGDNSQPRRYKNASSGCAGCAGCGGLCAPCPGSR